MAKMMEVKDDKGGDEYCYEDEKFEVSDFDCFLLVSVGIGGGGGVLQPLCNIIACMGMT